MGNNICQVREEIWGFEGLKPCASMRHEMQRLHTHDKFTLSNRARCMCALAFVFGPVRDFEGYIKPPALLFSMPHALHATCSFQKCSLSQPWFCFLKRDESPIMSSSASARVLTKVFDLVLKNPKKTFHVFFFPEDSWIWGMLFSVFSFPQPI